jgi:serine/threonine protein phosphatase PrpC
LGARSTTSFLPIGGTIGGREITSSQGPDDALAKGADGVVVLIAVGDPVMVKNEATAARALSRRLGAPGLVEQGQDERRGAFVALTPVGENVRTLASAAPELGLAAMSRVARAVLDLVDALEREGFRFTPQPSDFYVDERGALVVSRLRVAPLERSRADACCPIAAMGQSLLPLPAVTSTTTLLRVLRGTGTQEPHEPKDAPTLRAMLDHAEKELGVPYDGPSHVATACDPGIKRDHNEDATAMATGETGGEPWTVMVVCDGVSCSADADQASRVAAKTACDALAHFARAGDIAHEAASTAMSAAIRAAHLAICASPRSGAKGEPPGTTLVAGLVYRGRLTVGWVGDSRAYWISRSHAQAPSVDPPGGDLLTRDHSWAAEIVARGEMSEEEAMRQPLAHALTRCLGPLEATSGGGPLQIEPDVRSRDLPGPGFVVLCTDGLWNYYPDARSLAELVHGAGPDATPHLLTRRLVNYALYRGGGDNVSVAIYAHSRVE